MLGFEFDYSTIALLYGVLLISLVVHEAAHATFAYLGGDPTAYIGGQVTLNPIPHIRREPFGTVVLPLASLFTSNGTMVFGYAHAPYDPVWAYRHPKRAALMAAAGPLSNLLLAALAFLVLKSMVWTEVAEPVHRMSPFEMLEPISDDDPRFLVAGIKMASVFLLLNVLLAIVNLLPLPPFDGAGIVEGVWTKTRGLYELIRQQFVLTLAGLIAVWHFLPQVFFPVMAWITDWL